MIRGVNRQIIEINNTGNKYFEKALLFVKPEFTVTEDGRLKSEADRMLAGLGKPPCANRSTELRRARESTFQKRKRRRLISSIAFVAAVLLGYFILASIFK